MRTQNKPTQLYRHWSADGQLLYVGISLSHMVRLSQHKIASPWFDDIARVTIEHYSSRDEARAAEIAAIQNERPKYNIQDSSGGMSERIRHEVESSATRRIVFQRAIYKLRDVAELLGFKSTVKVRKLIEDGELAAIECGMRGGKNGDYMEYKVSAWQIIAYLDGAGAFEI